MIDLSTFNEKQLEAVNWDQGPLLVLAGPGSGKTRVLAYRIARLIDATPRSYFRPLALTCSNKAVAEMREHIAALLPSFPRAGERVALHTFHSFSARLLRQHGSHLGLDLNFTILEQDADRRSLLDDAIDHAGVRQTGQTSEKLVPLVSRLMQKGISPDKAADCPELGRYEDPDALAAVYRSYRSLMIERGMLDFDGLVAEALGLLERHAGMPDFVRRAYPYILVDEFQDTNVSQYEMLKKITNRETRNVVVVADDDRVASRWNGSDHNRLKRLQKDFGMKTLQLPEDWRCPPGLLEPANKLAADGTARVSGEKLLMAHRKNSDASAVVVRGFARFREETDWVAETIAARPPEERAGCAILARTGRLLGQAVDSLQEHGVAGYLATRRNEFESASLQWLHSVLRLANSRSSREDLERVCQSFFVLEGIRTNVSDIVPHASANESDCLRSWAVDALGREDLSGPARELIRSSLVPRLLERLDFWRFQDDAFAWLDSLPDTAPDREGVFDGYGEERDAWRRFADEIAGRYGKREVTLYRFLQEFDLRSKSPDPPDGAVPCLTIHASRGMGFDHLYLVGMVEDQFPGRAATRKGDDSPEMQDERRNCFAAMTRARRTLTLTYSGCIGELRQEPSRFLYEMELL